MTYERFDSLNLTCDLLMIFTGSRISNYESEPTNGYPLPNVATKFIEMQDKINLAYNINHSRRVNSIKINLCD